MRPASQEFRDTVALSHAIAVQIEVLDQGAPIHTLTEETSAGASSVISGTVTLDAKAASRGRADITIVDDGSFGLVPTDARSLLAPYGNELRISRGVVLPSGIVEVVPLVICRIDTASVDDSGSSLTIAISGLDRSAAIIDAKFEDADEVAAGTNAQDAILRVIQQVTPDVEYVFPGVTFYTPLLRIQEGDDRWKFAQDVATACGLVLFYDGDGRLRLDALTDTTPVLTIAEGPGGLLLKARREWTRASAFNRLIATGENTGESAPARGVATDDDPNSPTYYGGRFGKNPRFYQSQFIVSDAQADAAAQGILKRELGTTQEVAFDCVVNPTLEPGDAIQMQRLRAGINEVHTVDTLTIPLAADGVMAGQTRATQS